MVSPMVLKNGLPRVRTETPITPRDCFGEPELVGPLTSPEFVIDPKHVTFLIGGGGFPGKTCVNLLVGGKVVRTATGPNTEPGGSEELEPASWDVAELAGKTARIEIVDAASGGW